MLSFLPKHSHVICSKWAYSHLPDEKLKAVVKDLKVAISIWI